MTRRQPNPKRITPEERERIMRIIRTQGLNGPQVAERFGLNRNTAKEIVAQARESVS